MWQCCWQKMMGRKEQKLLCLIPAIFFSPVIEISGEMNPLSWVKHSSRRNQLLTRTPGPERVASSPGRVPFMKTYADKHFLTAKKTNRESNGEATSETMSHPVSLSKPNHTTLCSKHTHPAHLPSARAHFGAVWKTDSFPIWYCPGQLAHPVPSPGPPKQARSCRRSPFLPTGTWLCSCASPASQGSPQLV